MKTISKLLIIAGILCVTVPSAIIAWQISWTFGAIIIGFELITLGAITPTSDTEA